MRVTAVINALAATVNGNAIRARYVTRFNCSSIGADDGAYTAGMPAQAIDHDKARDRAGR